MLYIYCLYSHSYSTLFLINLSAHNYLFSSSLDDDNNDDTVKALGRPERRCKDNVDPQISVIAKIPDHGDDDDNDKICTKGLDGVYDNIYGM